MALSDQLIDLAGRTKRLEEAAAAARAKDVAKMEEQREQLRSKAAQAKGGLQSWWTETTAEIEQQRAQMQAKREQRANERASDAATFYAETTEEFASALNSLAAYVAEEAAMATTDAGIARQQADEAAAKQQAPVA